MPIKQARWSVKLSPAAPRTKAGLQGSDKPFEANGEQIMIGGDVITAIDGKAIETMQELSAAVRAQKPGDEVELTVLRDGKEDDRDGDPGRAEERRQRCHGAIRTGDAERESAHTTQGGDFRRLAGDQRHDAHPRDR